MPRFHLHLRTGDELIEDPEGEAFDNIAKARTEAIAVARYIAAGRLIGGLGIKGPDIVITGEGGEHVMTVPFSEASKPNLVLVPAAAVLLPLAS